MVLAPLAARVCGGERRECRSPPQSGVRLRDHDFAHNSRYIGVVRGLVPKFGEVCCMHHDACCPRSSGSPGDRHACLLFAAGRFVRAKRSVRRCIYREDATNGKRGETALNVANALSRPPPLANRSSPISAHAAPHLPSFSERLERELLRLVMACALCEQAREVCQWGEVDATIGGARELR